jgi:hypothetical protein
MGTTFGETYDTKSKSAYARHTRARHMGTCGNNIRNNFAKHIGTNGFIVEMTLPLLI